MGKLILKGCPRCKGDMALAEEAAGYVELSCLQCGYAKPLHGTPINMTSRTPREQGRQTQSPKLYDTGNRPAVPIMNSAR